jgi:hypothetical protein
MIYHNFRSEDSNIPDLLEDIVAFAAIGTFFIGANNDIYIRTIISNPVDVNDWIQIYPNNDFSGYTFSDGTNDFEIINGDDVTIVTENGLYLLEASNHTFNFNSTYISGIINPVLPPLQPSLKWFYINVDNGTYWIWDNEWLNITNGGGLVDNLDGTYTGGGVTFIGTDNQTALEIITPTPKLGNTVLWNILNSVINTKLPIAQFETYDQVGLTCSVASFSSGDSLTYLWSVSPSTSVIITSNTASTTAITFPSVGKYEITLVVTDTFGFTHTTKKEIILDKTIYVNGSGSQLKPFTLLSDVNTWITTNDSSNATDYTIITNGIISSGNITAGKAKLVLLPTTTFDTVARTLTFGSADTFYLHGYGSWNLGTLSLIQLSGGATLYIDNIYDNGASGFKPNSSSGLNKLYLNNIVSTQTLGIEVLNSDYCRVTNSYLVGVTETLVVDSSAIAEVINCQLLQLVSTDPAFVKLDGGSGYIINSQISAFKDTSSTASFVMRLDFTDSDFAWYLHNNMIEMEGDTSGAITYPSGVQVTVLQLLNTHASSKAHISNCNIVGETLGMTVDDLLDPNVLFANNFISGENYSIYREVQSTDTLASWLLAKVYNTTLHRQHTTITYATPTATITGGNIQV